MTNELLMEKLDRAFAQLDVDSSGEVERDDVLGLGSRVLLGFGQLPTSAKGKEILDRYDELWNNIAAHADADGSGSISLQEYRDGVISAFVDGDKFESVFRPAAQAIANLADTDGDGMVGLAEFTILQQAFGMDNGNIEAAFAALDTSGDGQLSVDELVQAAKEFYTSTDPNAKGNLLFGPL